MPTLQTPITPFLWFDGQGEEAAAFYVSIFDHSRVTDVMRWPAGMENAGKVLTVAFQLLGMDFIALNAGPQHRFTPAVSLAVRCETQAEVDRLWSRLTEGGKEVACGWLEDRYGLSWQIVPEMLIRYIGDPDPVKARRVMEAMMRMVKIDIAAIERAYRGDAAGAAS